MQLDNQLGKTFELLSRSFQAARSGYNTLVLSSTFDQTRCNFQEAKRMALKVSEELSKLEHNDLAIIFAGGGKLTFRVAKVNRFPGYDDATIFRVESEDTVIPQFSADETALVKELFTYLMDDFCLPDYIYDIRNSELKGWDGPEVTKFSDVCRQIRKLLGR